MMKTWSQVSARLGRNDLPWCLSHHLDVLPQSEIAKGLADAWTMCEWPNRVGDNWAWECKFKLGLPDFKGFIDDKGVVHDTSELPETLTLYRGAHKDHIDGMSWTSELLTAKWFCERLGRQDMAIYTITIPRDLVLAKFDGRGEHEYVINATELFEDDIQLYEEEKEMA